MEKETLETLIAMATVMTPILILMGALIYVKWRHRKDVKEESEEPI